MRWFPLATLLLLTACPAPQDFLDDQGRWRLDESEPTPTGPNTPGGPQSPTDTARACDAGDFCFGAGCACFDICWGDTVYIRECVDGRWTCPEDTIATEVCPPLTDTCDPTDPASCGGQEACFYNLELGIFACMAPGERKEGSRCYFDNACLGGLLCVPQSPEEVGTAMNRCYQACDPNAPTPDDCGACISMRNRGFGRQEDSGFCTAQPAP